MKLRILLLFLIVAFINACKDDESPLLLFVTPGDVNIYAGTNEVITFKITCISNTSSLQNLVISEKVGDSYTVTIHDTALSGSERNIYFEYLTDYYIVTTEILLNFDLSDQNDQVRLTKLIIVEGNSLLIETAGHVMYSHESNLQDGYNLLIGTPLYTELSELNMIHIMDASVDSINGDILSKKWISPAGIKFVRYNDFNYANATKESVKQGYEIGIQHDYITNLEDEDIILTKIYDQIDSVNTYIAIKLVGIEDNDLTDQDLYRFNIKR